VMMYGGLNQPYDVPANQYLNFRGEKASTSKGTAPFVPDYLQRYDPDALRYYLSAIMPEASDADFSEDDLISRNNEELVATWGNLANRVLTLTFRNFDGLVPEPGELKATDTALLDKGDEMLAAVGESINACHFKQGLQTALRFAQETNRYLDQEAPWKAVSENRKVDAGRSLFTALGAIELLNLALYPYLPFSAQELHAMLGHDGSIDGGGWNPRRPQAGAGLGQPRPLFKKLEPLVPAGG
jgi:methionyl-tRNA synthetase